MIPTIGLMVATYIIIRLVLCLIALIVNLLGMIFLWQNRPPQPDSKPPEKKSDTR